MGWARTLLLGDVGNRLDIADCERDIQALHRSLMKNSRSDRSRDERIQALEKEVEHLQLAVATLSRLLVARGVLSEEDLASFGSLLEEEEEKA